MSKNVKYIFVTGGVISGLGKGIVSASIGKLIQSINSSINIGIQKLDGYMSSSGASLLNPVEHGETFVLEDGFEGDLDFGTYERFLNKTCEKDHSMTSGSIFKELLFKEERGDFLGSTVQVIPHLTGFIREKWQDVVNKFNYDCLIIEIGGTVGDLESQWFVEAARELISRVKKEDLLFIHLGFIPEIGQEEYQKTKPFQQSLQLLKEKGIFPDILIGRCKKKLTEKTKQKLSWLCNIPLDCIFSDPDLEFSYELPLFLEKEGMLNILQSKLKLKRNNTKPSKFNSIVKKLKNRSKTTFNIGICGKYTELHDSYLSIKESLIHASTTFKSPIPSINIEFIDTEKSITKDTISQYDGIIVPGGFGSRGIEGKIKIIKICRENNIPFLGLCYGLQLAVVEFARNVCKLKNANTIEVDPDTKYNVIDIMPEQKEITKKGGTMRLGSQQAFLKKGTLVRKIYGKDTCFERHRHRYEVNPEYHDILEKNGLTISGKDVTGRLVEFIEYSKNDFFLATQAHPELKSTLESPSLIFVAFLKSIKKGSL